MVVYIATALERYQNPSPVHHTVSKVSAPSSPKTNVQNQSRSVKLSFPVTKPCLSPTWSPPTAISHSPSPIPHTGVPPRQNTTSTNPVTQQPKHVSGETAPNPSETGLPLSRGQIKLQPETPLSRSEPILFIGVRQTRMRELILALQFGLIVLQGIVMVCHVNVILLPWDRTLVREGQLVLEVHNFVLLRFLLVQAPISSFFPRRTDLLSRLLRLPTMLCLHRTLSLRLLS